MEPIIAAYTAAENYDRSGNWSGWAQVQGEMIGMAVRGPKKVRIWLANDTSKETTIHLRKGVGPVTYEEKVHDWVKKHAGSRASPGGGVGGGGLAGHRPLEDDL